MSLAVIGPGFGRTGTMSLKHALEQLGFGPCHHMEEVFAHPEQVPHWQAVAAGRPVVWDDVFAGWWTSFSATIGALFDAPDQVPLPPHLRIMRDVAIEMIQVQTFGCPSTDREGVLAAYRRRTEEVCAAIPAERLLVFNVAEGWAPLCRFLDVPVPDTPFPRMNSTEQFWKTVRGEQH
jgi:Sulfotransferase domain